MSGVSSLVHDGGKIGRYNCYGARTDHGAVRRISISGLSIDAAISNEVLRVLKPRMRRQYDAVDPANRLVAGELERRWNTGQSEQPNEVCGFSPGPLI